MAWYRKAAEQGIAKAQFNLGVMYFEGRGVQQDDTEAVAWYRKAAEQGDNSAQFNLGWMYYYGRGIEENYTIASEWFRETAKQGHERAREFFSYPSPDLSLDPDPISLTLVRAI